MFRQNSFVSHPLPCSNAVSFHLSQAHGRSLRVWGASAGFTKLSQDGTETRIKLKVARGQVARYEPDDSELPPFLGPCRASLRN